MSKNLKLVINNPQKIEEKQFFEKDELKNYFRLICKNGLRRILERLWFKYF